MMVMLGMNELCGASFKTLELAAAVSALLSMTFILFAGVIAQYQVMVMHTRIIRRGSSMHAESCANYCTTLSIIIFPSYVCAEHPRLSALVVLAVPPYLLRVRQCHRELR